MKNKFQAAKNYLTIQANYFDEKEGQKDCCEIRLGDRLTGQQ